ncbi:MAG: BMC domain-containing protein [Acidobacteria bacterium]|nr:MAG: BMC domain-containing protein [Acidobacteriota bacterium]
MKKASALALIEFGDISAGVFAVDAMLKKAPIAFIRSGTVSRGRYLVVVGGSPAAVEESYHAGLQAAGEPLDHLLLADVHPSLYEAIVSGRRIPAEGALAVLETETATLSVRSAEAALKGTPVTLVELRLADGGLNGKGVAVYQGRQHDVEAAVALALDEARRAGGEIRYTVVSSPHEALGRQLAKTSRFDAGDVLDLDGEVL